MPIIAEDLGVITDDVNELRIAIGAPGMVVPAVRLGIRAHQHPHPAQSLREQRLLPRSACENVACTARVYTEQCTMLRCRKLCCQFSGGMEAAVPGCLTLSACMTAMPSSSSPPVDTAHALMQARTTTRRWWAGGRACRGNRTSTTCSSTAIRRQWRTLHGPPSAWRSAPSLRLACSRCRHALHVLTETPLWNHPPHDLPLNLPDLHVPDAGMHFTHQLKRLCGTSIRMAFHSVSQTCVFQMQVCTLCTRFRTAVQQQQLQRSPTLVRSRAWSLCHLCDTVTVVGL